MRKTILGAAILAATLIPAASLIPEANAQGRPDARRMTCHQAASLVAQYGSLVITTGRFTYDRVVSQMSLCGPLVPRFAVVPTLDNPACRIGYQCFERVVQGR